MTWEYCIVEKNDWTETLYKAYTWDDVIDEEDSYETVKKKII